jgi:hypothetical protein
MVSFRKETYGVFGLPEPAVHNQPRPGKTTGWFPECDARIRREFETGQVAMDKRRAWAGLNMVAAINKHHDFFMQRLFRGDKMTFYFGFAASDTPFSLVCGQSDG